MGWNSFDLFNAETEVKRERVQAMNRLSKFAAKTTSPTLPNSIFSNLILDLFFLIFPWFLITISQRVSFSFSFFQFNKHKHNICITVPATNRYCVSD